MTDKGEEKRRCEFCGEIRFTASTTFVCNYCAECHSINAEQSRDAIKEIRKMKKEKP